jgi:hypothetical protein
MRLNMLIVRPSVASPARDPSIAAMDFLRRSDVPAPSIPLAVIGRNLRVGFGEVPHMSVFGTL